MPVTALSVESASLSFGTYRALRDVSFAASQGQLVTLLGPSGCGKTTLLKAIAGFIPLDGGRIVMAGRDMAGVPPERRDTAMCFQSYALFPHLSVADNIAFGLRQRRMGPADIRQRVEQVAIQTSLTSQLAKLPGQLSGGQQQRVALARAMAVRPGVMLFDEPLSNLDAKLRDQVRMEIRQLQRDHGFTAVYVTHDQAEALAMSDLVVVMNNGAIEQMGSPEAIYSQPVNRFVADFIGTANIMPVKVTSRDGVEFYRVESPLGPMLIRSTTPPVADHVHVCWRPEDAILFPASGEPQNRYLLKVRTRVFLGNLSDVIAAGAGTAAGPFRIQTHGFAAVAEGDEIEIAIPAEKLRFLREAVQ